RFRDRDALLAPNTPEEQARELLFHGPSDWGRVTATPTKTGSHSNPAPASPSTPEATSTADDSVTGARSAGSPPPVHEHAAGGAGGVSGAREGGAAAASDAPSDSARVPPTKGLPLGARR